LCPRWYLHERNFMDERIKRFLLDEWVLWSSILQVGCGLGGMRMIFHGKWWDIGLLHWFSPAAFSSLSSLSHTASNPFPNKLCDRLKGRKYKERNFPRLSCRLLFWAQLFFDFPPEAAFSFQIVTDLMKDSSKIIKLISPKLIFFLLFWGRAWTGSSQGLWKRTRVCWRWLGLDCLRLRLFGSSYHFRLSVFWRGTPSYSPNENEGDGNGS